MPILFLIIFLGSCSVGPGTEINVYPQLGHSDTVSTAVFSADGRYIVSASWDMSVKLWDTGTGRERAAFLGHTDVVNSAAISGDNRFIASAARDGTVRIWDTETGREKIKLEENAFNVAFNTDNKSIITFSINGIKQWDIETGNVIQTFSDISFALTVFSPDSQFIASGTDKTLVLNVKTGDEFIVNGKDPNASAMAISNGGLFTALGGWDGSVSLIETESGEKTKLPPLAKYVTAMAFSGNNRFLAAASADGIISIYDLDNYHFCKSIQGHNESVNSLFFSPDESAVVSASSDKTIKIWNVTGMEQIITIGGHCDPPRLSVISHDYIASLSRAGSIKIWNAKTGEFIEAFDAPEGIKSMCFSPDNENLVTVSRGGIAADFNIKTGKTRQLSQDESFAIIRSVNTGGRIVSVLWDGSIEIWDYTTGEKRQLKNDDEIVNAIGLDNEGKKLAAGFYNGKLRVTDTETGKTVSLLQYTSPVDAVGFSADGLRLACGLRDGSVRLLDISAGTDAVPPMRHLFGVSSVSFSDDGRYVISSAADNSVILWDAATGKKIASFLSFDDDEWITITPDGYYNASPRGDERLNVRIGSGVYGMDQFSAVFFQAEVVKARLQGLSDPAVTRASNSPITAPPAISISAPQESETGKAVIDISIKDNFRPLHSVQIVINGRLLGHEELGAFSGAKNIAVKKTSLVVKDKAHELQFSIPVALEAGSNHIQIIASNRGRAPAGAVSRKSVYIVNISETKAPPSDLWVLAIGSNGNLNKRGGNSLKYAVNNAKGIQSLFESQRGKRYRNVHTRLIADGEKITPSRKNIIRNIREFFGKARSGDVLVLYLSGHGEERKGNGEYYFLPQAVSLDDIGIVSERQGRKMIFIDSCFSGGVDGKGMARNLKNESTVIITSSQKDERSWEGSAAVPYGFFTEALISGIGGEAAVNNEVRLFNLGEYVYSKVMLLSGGMQHPYVYVPEGFYGFVLAGSGE
ncbi:MAG: caspase family protein [Spirochaetaceae bacterium]|jgi:WD40 repeat protein|nr:caspase family protein [Spirochaetaceae bacterium]